MVVQKVLVTNKREKKRKLTNDPEICYSKIRILEVFALYKATKTFDFVAFFVETF